MEFFFYALHCGLLFLSSVAAIAAAVLDRRTRALDLIARLVFMGAGLSLLASIGIRMAESGRLPFATMYEFGLLMGVVVFGLTLWLDLSRPAWRTKAFLMPTAFILASVMLLFFQEARPLMPALKSWWLTSHVLTAVISYGLLVVAAACALFARLGLWRGRDILAPSADLEGLAMTLNTLAFPFLTLLIITGAVWAEYAWGSFWRWDPKETWALITWLVYLFLLHAVKVRGWKGRRALNLTLIAFGVVIFTFFGVNLLLSGLHSYA